MVQNLDLSIRVCIIIGLKVRGLELRDEVMGPVSLIPSLPTSIDPYTLCTPLPTGTIVVGIVAYRGVRPPD